jgi:hypothetical protein
MGELKSRVEKGIVKINSDLHKVIAQLIYFKGFAINYSRVLRDLAISRILFKLQFNKALIPCRNSPKSADQRRFIEDSADCPAPP